MASSLRTIALFASLVPLVFSAGCAAPTDDPVGGDESEIRRSDLDRDLRQPGGWLGTPFDGWSTHPVSGELAAELGALVERCVQYRETETRVLPTKNLCPTEIKGVVRDAAKVTERASIALGGRSLTAVIWDNERSDGGDVQDLAIYDANGKRIGLYRTIFGRNDTVLDSLEAAFGHTFDPVVIPDAEYAKEALADAAHAVEAACQAASPSSDCTYAASRYDVSEAEWSSASSAPPALRLLSSRAAIEEAFGRCLLSVFAYYAPSPTERAAAASALYEQLGSQFFVYEADQGWARPANGVEILSSANVGGPDCAIVLKTDFASSFLHVASDVQD